MVTTTWARDSHDLFDYEARHVNTKVFTIKRPMKCFRVEQDVQIVPDASANPPNSDYLVRFTANKEGW